MACGCTAEELAELATLETMYAAINAAILAILSGAQEYLLDTGQSRQNVKKADLDKLRTLRSEIQDEIGPLKDRCSGNSGSVYVRPAF